MSRWSQPYLGARVILSDGRVIDLVGKVSLQIDMLSDSYGDGVPTDGPCWLDLRLSSRDFTLYMPGDQAPEHPPEQYRALASGAPAFPTEVVDGEILPED